jgi:predicted alpha/beta superfamily hydrolase
MIRTKIILFNLFIYCLFQLVVATEGFAQEGPVIPWTSTSTHYSTSVKDTFSITVALPEGYADTGKKYPVVFVTDPRFGFGTAVESARALAIEGTISPVIMVGIGYPGSQDFGRIMQLRSRDFSTVSDPQVPGGWDAWAEDIEWGGADAFIQFIEGELIPYIEKNFSVSDDRTYMGWSGGGHLGAYILFTKPELFRRYLLVSAPFEWFHKGIAFDYEAAYAAQHDDLNAQVFFSVGTEETESTVNANIKMVDILEKREYEGLQLFFHEFEDKKHYAVWPLAINEGLQVLFQE